MAKKEEVTKGGANQITKGVHVNHEFDTFENVTYSNSTWSVECNDKDASHTRKTTMQRRSWVDEKKKDVNIIQMAVRGATSSDDVRGKELQFSCDGETVMVKETYNVSWDSYYFTKDDTRYKRYKNRWGFSISDKDLKQICDADTVYLRVISVGHYFDIADEQTLKMIEFMKCYYREVIDEKAYPEVADVQPKIDKPMSTKDMAIGCGVILGVLWLIGQFI